MARQPKPVLVQLETQGRITLLLLPHVAALPFLSDEAIARVFGQTMALLNWTRAINSAMQMLKKPLEAVMPEPPKRTPRTKEEQRIYWRDVQRRRRATLRASTGER